MPFVHFVGEISFSAVSIEVVSVTFAIVPGNAAWFLRRGVSSGETQSSKSSQETGKATIAHPIDCQYETSTSEGWPLLICEVWDRSEENYRGFVGCGSMWLPSQSGYHHLEIPIWRPRSDGLDGLTEMLLPSIPDLQALRELNVSPFLRSQIKTESQGVVGVKLSTVRNGFEIFGVQFD